MSFLRLLPVLLLLASALSQGAFPTLYLKPVVLQQFHSPTCITYAPDGSGRVFVVDQPGRVHIIESGMMRPTPFLDISSTAAVTAHRKVIAVGTGYVERGLLGLAFHPGYANPASPGYRKFYVNYNKAYQAGMDPPAHDSLGWTPNCTTVIAEFQVSATDPNSADPLSERKLLLYAQPQPNHNGGNVVMDSSGLLYIGSGDGGNANDVGSGHNATNALGNGQDKTVYLGKILRIDPLGTNGPGGQYGIPPGNPLVGAGGGVKEEIYAFGIRNPWGLSFDDGPGGTGRLFCADVGQDRIEEVNLITNGGNYGWRYMEGNERPTFSSTMAHPGGTLIAPIVEYAHPSATSSSLPKLGLSITGGSVYRGSAIPALQGKYVFGDYGATSGSPSGTLMGLEETAPGSGTFTFTTAIPLLGGNPFSMRVISMGEDGAGEIYVGTKISSGATALENGLPNGGLYKLVPVPTNPAPITLTAVKDNSMFSEGELSNGTGDLFAGTSSGGDLRRALLSFDLSSVPASTRIGSAILQLRMTNAETPSGSPPRNTLINRVTQSWGEAGSFSASGGVAALSGDVTFVNRFYSSTSPVPWDNEGGDFFTTAPVTLSASLSIRSELGYYAFQGPQMVNDVQAWLTGAAANHGWIMRSDEGANSTTKRFSSRENADASSRPKLTLVQATPYQSWLAAYFAGLLTGQYLDPEGDSDGDGIYNQIEYAYGLNPTAFNASDNFTTTVTPAGGNVDLTLTFRRDTQATDLTYRLQISEDLTTWTTIAESAGGAAATGQNGGSVLSDAGLGGTVNLVTVKRTLSGTSANKQFVRLNVERAP